MQRKKLRNPIGLYKFKTQNICNSIQPTDKVRQKIAETLIETKSEKSIRLQDPRN